MAWNWTDSELSTYLQELAAESSLTCCSDTGRSVQSRSRNTPEASCSSGRKTDTCPDSQSGTTSTLSTESPGEDSLTASAADSPVRTYPPQVKVRDLPEAVQDFGSKCYELLKKFNLDLSSRKTVRTCVPVGSAPSSKDLPAWGMTFDGACWELGTSVQITSGIGCGYLPIPQSSDHIAKATSKSWKSQGRVNFTLSNPEIQKMWPTPRVMNAPRGPNAQGGASLEEAAGGKLNPTWTEWIMGWPLEWTGSKPLAMGKFLSWLQLHGVC